MLFFLLRSSTQAGRLGLWNVSSMFGFVMFSHLACQFGRVFTELKLVKTDLFRSKIRKRSHFKIR